MRGASVLLTCGLLLCACMGTAPTPSPTTAGVTPAPTAAPTAAPSPTLGPPDDRGLPTSILGLPTYTVAGLSQIAAAGALDGRFAAVAGYWAQFALPCPYMPHQPVILGFCSGGSFADTAEAAQTCCGTGSAPLAVAETAGGDRLWAVPGTGAGVVLIVHADDSRQWQCAAADRAACQSRLVIDSVGWVDGASLDLAPVNADLTVPPVMTLGQVIAAAVAPGEQLVTAYPLMTRDLNEVDPRFMGQGHGIVWYVRVISGAPDANSTAGGKDVLINDESGEVVATLPLSVDPAFSAARLEVDSNGWEASGNARPRYQVFKDGIIVAEEWLDSSATPLALEPGGYTLHAYLASDPLAVPRDNRSCDLPLPLIAGDDVGYYADFSGEGCEWKPGRWPFN